MSKGFFSWIESRILEVAGLAIFAALVLMVIEVFNRFVLHVSFEWAAQLIRLLIITAVFLSIGPGLRRGVHVRITILVSRFPYFAQKYLSLLVYVMGFCLMTALTWWGLELVKHQYFLGLIPIEGLPLPNYISYSLIPLGTCISMIYFLVGIVDVIKNGKTFTLDEEEQIAS